MFNSRIMKKVVIVSMVAMLAAGGVLAVGTSKKRQKGGGLMRAIPSESLLCVRINRFDETLDSVNAFLKDVAPAEADAKEKLLSKLTGLLGSDRLRGVNKRGNIAIFVVNVPGETAGRGPMGNMFIGLMLPVTKYENFISQNPNCSEPDEEGISTVTVNEKVQALATNFQRHAVLCPPNARENLIKVRKLLSQRKRSLGAGLEPEVRKQAASSPVWVYLNVKQGTQFIQPILFGGLEKMKAELEKAKEKGEKMPVDPEGIVSFYGGIIKTALEGTENVTVALAPSAEACNVSLGLKPVADSTMAAIVGESLEGDLDDMLGYLEDGAMFNLATKVDRKSLKTGYSEMFKLIGKMIPGGITEADLEELQKLMTKGIDAMGDSAAITLNIDSEQSPPFVGKYVIEVKDRETFEEILQKELQMMEDGAFANMYKGMGLEMDVEINHDAGKYKGVQIGGAKVVFKGSGDDEKQAQIFEKMFGGGLDYRWAFEKGYCVYAVGSNAGRTVGELIEQVRAGGPEEISPEIKAAMESIPESNQADVIGTINYVRAITMAFGLMPLPEDFDRTKLQVASNSNIAFAGRTTDEGKLALQIVLPKKHLQEIQSVFKTVIPEIEKHHKEMREKQHEEM